MLNSCCPDLLVNISTEYPELIGYEGLYHLTKNETTGRGGKKIPVLTGDFEAGRRNKA